ncbi:aminopeptidase N [Jiangella sp. DSM 45060]|uniref:aminopeptidase N n=1 Tax=Jiangella sp. DSM 45060 TaxID=1798224 RepID=UPI00087D4874|nr:aminopeptidase N [Jiangella sp. DSM 45060]SDT49301.1 Membrane alanyl aminopeptidase Metallo peptidase. MEROPS family M01 [Jiangella sp. DSM 45060]
MSGTNLTRDEARDRASVVDPASVRYTVELDLTRGETTFGSTTTATFAATEGAETWLDLIAPTVHEVVLNGTALDPADVYDGARVRLTGLTSENEVKVVADAAYMHTGEGLHRFVDPVDDEVYLYSQFEVADARRVYACFEQPDLKAEVTFLVDAPSGWQVVSNSPGKAGKASHGKKRWTFEPTPRLSTYVTAIVAGPYHVERSEHVGKEKTIPLALYCRKSLAEHLDADELFDVTSRGFAFFEDVFGLAYPFAKYDQLFVPEFNAGAMENAGAVTHHEDYVFRSRVTDAAYERRAETILHEMAHMWFGDLVTMRWWDDLWLNESFATWASVLSLSEATRWTDGWTTFAVTEKLWALRQDQLPSTHPISADIRHLEDVEVNFDGITYAKGASVLKQLVAWVGRDAFLEGVRAYFAEHAWGNTSLGDLFAHLERTSGRDLSEWNEQWLRTAGVNTLRPVVTVDNAGAYTSVAIEQTAATEHPAIRSHRAAIGLYDYDDDGVLVRRRRIELDVDGPRTEVAELRGETQPDLLLVNDDDLTFAKVRLDDRSLATVVRSIGSLDPLPRALCWTAATDMLRDAEMSASSFVELVLGGIERETSMGVVQHVLASARAAIELYAWPANRTLLSSRWAAALRQSAGSAEAGSDRQLAFTRAWVSAAASDEHVTEIRALLDGDEELLPGLVVDTDLRWTLLQRLVVLGVAGDDAIDAELERDNTATGQRQAAYARAAVPSYAAKAAAWQAVVESDELPNALLSATVRGFAQPEQRELVRAYVQPYLDAVPRVWAERTNESAQAIVVGLFPRLLADAATAATVRGWLETAELPDAARRLVVEGLADLDRALRAQERDSQAG